MAPVVKRRKGQSVVFIDSFCGAIGKMKRADQGDRVKVLTVLAGNPRFSCFDAGENDVIAQTMTSLMTDGYIEYPTPQPGYPWCKARLTAKALALLPEGTTPKG